MSDGANRRAGTISVRRAEPDDVPWVVEVARRQLGSEHQVHSRRLFRVDEHELLVAELDGTPVGFLAWVLDGVDCEVLAIASEVPRVGVGTALMRAAGDVSRDHGSARLHLTTTDANVGAQRFYEALGFRLAERLVGAVDECRARWKPDIPADMHDELVYERLLP